MFRGGARRDCRPAFAPQGSQLVVARKLLDGRADPRLKDNAGLTPLDVAEKNRFSSYAEPKAGVLTSRSKVWFYFYTFDLSRSGAPKV